MKPLVLPNFFRRPALRRAGLVIAAAGLLGLSACTTILNSKPPGWQAPVALVAPSSFNGVHGLAVDYKGRLLAGSVVGNSLWEVDRNTGAARVMIPAPEGQADDIAVGPKTELAWTNYLMGMVRYRESDSAPIRVLAKDLARHQLAGLRSPQRQALRFAGVPR